MPSRFRLDRSPKRAAAVLLAAAAALAASTGPSRTPPQPSPTVTSPRIRPGPAFPAPPYAPHAPNDLIIKFRDGVPSALQHELRTEMRAAPRPRFRAGAEQWRLQAGESVEQAIARLSGDPRVEYAEPNYLLRADRLPDDPRLTEQYALHNTGQTGGTPGADVDALRAWNISTGRAPGAPLGGGPGTIGDGGGGVVIAVIDSGVDWHHPDLRDNIFVNRDEIADNGLDDDGNGFVDDVSGWDFANGDNDPFDDVYHGTHVAGIAAAAGDNGRGVAGVAWRARLLPVKFLAADGNGFSADAIRSIDYAALMGARVLNNSWGGGAFSNAMFDTIAAVGTDGVLFVAAAGNDGELIDAQPHYPASYPLPNVLAVAATDDHDNIASFSSYGGRTVLLGAPGVGILSTLPGGGYGLLNGTSMAAPMVSGAAALLWAVEPALTIPQVQARLAGSAKPVPALAGKTITGARLDLFRLLARPDAIPPAAVGALHVVEAGSGHVRLGFTASGDDGLEGRASTYDVRAATPALDPAHLDDATAFPNHAVPLAPGSDEILEVTGLAPSTTYQFAVRARDEWDSAGPSIAIVSATTLPPPSFAAAPAEVTLSIPAGMSGAGTMAISNTGPGTLDWTVEALEERPTGPPTPPAWLAFDPPAGRVGAASTAPLRLLVATAGLAAGEHRAAIRIRHNDPARPEGEPTLVLHVVDASTLVLAPAVIDFGEVVAGTSAVRYVGITNTGTALLDILGIVSDSDAVIPSPAPAVVAAGATFGLPIRFAPASAGPVDARVSVVTLAANAAEVPPIVVRGVGLGPPALAIAPTSIATTLRAGARITIPIRLRNEGGSDLVVHVESRAPLAEMVVPWLQPGAADVTVTAGGEETLDLRIDAGGLSPGTQEAMLRLSTNIPGGVPAEIPISVQVIAGPHLLLEGPEVLLESRVSFDASGAAIAHRLDAPIAPAGGGSLVLDAEGDYGSRLETTHLLLEGRDLGTLRGGDPGSGGVGGDNGGVLPPDCNAVSMTRPLDAGDLAALLEDGIVEAVASNSAAVDPTCPDNRHTLQIRYAPRIDVIDFGALLPGTARRRQVLARNAGSEPLHGTLRLTGDAGFAVDPQALDLAPGASASVTLLFSAGSAPAGAAARLDLDSDDPDQPHLETALRASVLEPLAVEASPASVAATLLEGRIESHPIRLANRGSAPLTLSLSIAPGAEATSPADCQPEAIYAAAFNSGDVRERDLTTGVERTVVSGLFGPRALAVSPDGRRLYATEFNGRLATADLVAGGTPSRLSLGLATPSGIVLDPTGETAWITGFGTGDLGRVALASGTVAPVAGGLFGPHGLALDPDGHSAWVVEESRGDLARVDRRDGRTSLVASGLGSVAGLALDAAAGEAYVSLPSRGLIAAVDLVTGATREVASGLSTPLELVLDPARRRLYVGEFSASRVTAIDLASGAKTTVIASIPSPGGLALRLPAVCSARFARLDASQVEIPAGGSADAPLVLDSTGLAPGRRTATLLAGPSSPFLPLARVPVALDVVPRARISLSGQTQTAESTATFLTSSARTTHTLRFSVPPGAAGRLEVTVEGDFGSTKETADVIVEGTLVGNLGASGTDCVATTKVFTLPLPFLRSVEAGGVVEVVIQNTTDVIATCPVNRHRVRLAYDNADPEAGIDFGTVDAGSGRTLSLTVRNTGFAPLNVSDVRGSDPACTASPAVFSVAPGGLRGLTLRCAPPRPGPFTAALRIASDDPDRPVLETAIVATAVEPPRLALGADRIEAAVPEQGTLERLLTMSNTGGRTLSFSASIVDPDTPSDLKVARAVPTFVTVQPASGSVEPGASLDLHVTFRAGVLAPGQYPAQIAIANDDPFHQDARVAAVLTVEADRDRDGVPDARDDCPAVPDPDQPDADHDLAGDRCDNCPTASNPDQADADADGSGDACQPTVRIEAVREDGGARLEVQAALADPQGDRLSGTVSLTPLGAAQAAIVVPFSGRLPALTDIAALPAGARCRLEIRVNDGSSLPAAAAAEFLHQQETVLVIDRPPRAAFSAPEAIECDRPLAGRARLDGRATADDDSTAGTSDDVTAWEWSARLASGSVVPVTPPGSGPVVEADLPLGTVAVLLRVTDTAGESDQTERPLRVLDSVPPVLTLAADPGVLWPPDHRLREVRLGLQASDACDPAPATRLVEATSSEPDDAPGSGDGTTTGDIVATPGCEIIRLRAERSANGPGRTYRVVCETRDRSGNAASSETIVLVNVHP
jgi:subtilisin family serine protease